MSLGAMMSGGNPAEGREERDLYRTPTEAVLALLQCGERFSPTIWEPACGDGRIVRPFEAAGHKVIASDIHPLGVGKKVDFLKVPPKPIANDIITNPPFDLAEEFIRHALAFQPRLLVLLLKATYWHADKRAREWDAIGPSRVYAMAFRLDFKDLGAPAMECSWFVWERGYAGETIYKRPLQNPLPKTRSRVKPVAATATT